MKRSLKFLSLFLICILTFLLTACIPSDVESARQKMEEAGYFVEELGGDEEDGIIGGINAIGFNEGLIALYFESSTLAKEYAKDWVDSKYSVTEYNGNWAYIGTSKAVKDFKK